MSLDTGRYQLYSTWKTAKEKWDLFQESWNDPIRRQFEEKFWAPVQPLILRTLSAIDKLSQEIIQMRRECDT
jgi:hypothetical protein